MTVMMFYRRRASPKHRYDMTKVEYGGRGHRTRLRNDHGDQLVCPRVPPTSVYNSAMISDLKLLCCHQYMCVLDPILQVVVTYYVL